MTEGKEKDVLDQANLFLFKESLTKLINYHSLESLSNTPDFILAEYLFNCLIEFSRTSKAREKWYGKELKI